MSLILNAHHVPNNKASLSTIPESPGVYIFRANDNTPLYVGKAKNLKSRLTSYFAKTLVAKTARMVSEAVSISYIEVSSEIESLLLEAKLVKKFQPHYNVELRDDKHPLYIVITNETYPRILTARKTEALHEQYKAVYGPFPNSTAVRSVLRLVRKIAPYAQHSLGKRACTYNQIGLCDPCPNAIESETNSEVKETLLREYRSNIRTAKGILEGRIRLVEKKLIQAMQQYASHEEYELAARTREQLSRLRYITTSPTKVEEYIHNPNFIEDIREQELAELSQILSDKGIKIAELRRIECFDVAHLSGVSPASSMVTFVDGQAEKKLYRHFRIYQKKSRSDVDSLRETIERRMKHLTDWGVPDLIIVDGGKPQVSTFFDIIPDDIPVVGLAKRFETLVVPQLINGKKVYSEIIVPKGPARNLIQRMRDEAHRFSRRYHHKLLSKDLLQAS